METNCYSVYDIKARVYGKIYLQGRHEEAIRSFANACKQDGSNLKANPEDYNLHYLGTFNQETGNLVPVTPAPLHLAHATDYVQM